MVRAYIISSHAAPICVCTVVLNKPELITVTLSLRRLHQQQQQKCMHSARRDNSPPIATDTQCHSSGLLSDISTTVFIIVHTEFVQSDTLG